MQDPELMGYRIAIGQILADAGINRETIKDMLRQTIDEKVERQIGNVMAHTCSNYKFQEDIRRQLSQAIAGQVKDAASKIQITANVDLSTYSDEELHAELRKRTQRAELIKKMVTKT